MHIRDRKKMLSLNSPFFDQMRSDLDVYIQKAVLHMDQKGISDGAISLKIEISTERGMVNDSNSPSGEREALIPIINYKLAMTMQAKADRKGKIIGAGHELVHDDTGAMFVLTSEEASGQMSLFDDYTQEYDEDENVVSVRKRKEEDE